MDRFELGELVKRYLDGSATAEEKQVLQQWYKDFDDELEVNINEEQQTLHDRMLARLQQAQHPVIKSNPWKRIAIAASFIIVAALAVFYFTQNNKPATALATIQQQDISPGSSKAILIKSDGTKVELENNGITEINENGAIIKNTNGELNYQNSSAASVVYNTLQVPLKGVYSIVLADGTKVWLNSLSSIHYPTIFTGKERKVKITGEAYFEVAKNTEKPFIVMTESSPFSPFEKGGHDDAPNASHMGDFPEKEMSIEVLGTSFNINAYHNEPSIKTSLLEGSIKISASNKTKILSPGEEANLSSTTLSISNIKSRESVLAWKNGLFICNGTDLKTIMRQVMRWYDVEVEYEGNIQPETFIGQIPRSVNLSELLKVLEITGVHFKMEGKKITVLP